MKRRHLVVLVSAATLLVAVFIAVVTIGVGVGTDTGRDTIRSLVQQQVGGRINGKLYLGKIGGGFLTGFTIDTFAIRGLDDSLLVSTGRIKVDYDLRDLLDRRILLRNVEIDRLFVRLQQFAKGDWNHERIFRRGGPKAPNAPGSSFGDYVVLENVRGGNAQITVIRPWAPNDSLKGARRDSAIAYNLNRKDKEYRRSAEGFTHVYRWTKASAVLPRVRIADPDSTKFGMLFTFERLNAEEQDPPFSFRNVRGNVRKLGDSLWLQVPHFDLPASTGSATGKVWWGSHLPTRLDIRVKGDSVALNDVAWVYPTFPRTGSGRTDLRITNYPGRINDFQYELTNLDARSNRSRVTGAMTFISSGPVLQITDVNAVGAPVNFDLLRTFAGAPLPVDWQGDLWGYVKGPGGPLTNFVVSESEVTFRDAHVPGAVSRGSARGELNILDPEFTVFHGFEVNAEVIDTRSLEFLFPSFPRIHGTVAGSAVLDSIWTDVRFSKANMTHRNMPGEPSRVTGSGRVTYGELMTFDVNVVAQPVSLTMMSAAYDLGIKGLMSGPIRARGTSNDMQVTAQLEGPAGRISYTGRADAYPLSVAARGGGRVDALDLSQFVDAPGVPAGWVTGTYQVDVRYDTTDFSTITGMAAAQVERAELDSNRIYPSRFRARFGQGRMFLDTLRVESAAATITADGVIGLKQRGPDSLRYSVAVDSLGGLRRYVSKMLVAMASPQSVAADSLSGKLSVTGAARGALADLDVSGAIGGSELFIRRGAGRRMSGAFALQNLFVNPSGGMNVKLDTLNVGVIALDTLGITARLESARRGGFSLGARAVNGVSYSFGGDLTLGDSLTEVVVRELAVVTDSSKWALRREAPIRFGSAGVGIDSLAIGNGKGGNIALEGFIPDTGKGRLLFRADSVSLHDLSVVTQLSRGMSGWAHVAVQGAGTSAAPVMNAQMRLSDVKFGTLALNTVTANAFYSKRRADVELDIARGERPELFARASLPVELRYFGIELLDDSLHGTLRTDSGSVQLLEMLLPVSSGSGKLVANLNLGGTLKHPDLSGPVRIENGEATVDSLGIRLRGINVDLALFGHADSLHINRFSAWSGASAADAISLGGFIRYRDLSNPVFNLQLVSRTFRAIDKRDVARLDISTTNQDGLQLRGPLKSSSVTGNVRIDRGVIYLPDPELVRKQIDLAATEDSVGSARSIPLLNYVNPQGVTLTLGEEVFLRSRESAADKADIKLAGALTVARVFMRERELGTVNEDLKPQIQFDGVLRAERGTYSLSLDPTGLLVRKDFQVESGTVTLQSSTLGQGAQLNISAIHTVRTSLGDDLRIRARLVGDIKSPSVVLESGESFAISQSDIVSYLIFGQPNFEIGTSNQTSVQTVLRAITPSLGQEVRGVARRLFGSTFADLLQVETAVNLQGLGFGQTNFSTAELFSRTRVGAETRVANTNVFVSVSTPICIGGQGANQAADESYFYGLSAKIDWRLSRDASIQAGREPSALVCGRNYSGRVVATPAQWGVSVFKSWRF